MLTLFKNLKLGVKLSLGFGLVLVLTAIIAVIGYMGIERVLYRAQTEDMVAQLATFTLEARQHEKNFIIRGDARYIEEVRQRIDTISETARATRERLYDPADQQRIDRILNYQQNYFKAFEAYVSATQRQNEATTQMIEQGRVMQALINSLIEIERQRFGAWAVRQTTTGTEADAFATDDNATSVEELNQNRADVNTLMRLLMAARVHEKNFIIREDPDLIPEMRSTVEEIRSLLNALKARQRDASYIATINEVTTTLARYEETFSRYTRLETEQNDAEREMIAMAQQLLMASNEISNLQQERMTHEGHRAENIMLISALAAILFGILAAFFITRLITVPVMSAVTSLKRIADGDLDTEVKSNSNDEIGQLMQALAYMVENLRRIVSEVRSATELVFTASGEISAGNADLSQRTEEQASSLEETASSMEQMTATVKQNADNAQQANQLALRARDTAEQGGQVVANTVSAMSEINQSSSKIADIISVIDEIAFQTNLLALNAAVEAARAGEQGRGFAVVAGEVRNLAQRSAEAAKEIKKLIQDSVAKVEQGSELVNESGTRLEEIVQAVKRVTDIVSEIAAASQEQATGVEEVNKAVMQMDTVTQQNAALVEEAASASRSLADQSAKLREAMEFFKLELVAQHNQGHAPPTTRQHQAQAPKAKTQSAKSQSASKPAGSATQKTAAHATARPATTSKAMAPSKTQALKPAPKLTPKPVSKPQQEDDDEWTEF